MSTETTDTIYVTNSGKFVPVNKLALVGEVKNNGTPMRAAHYYTCTFLDGSDLNIGYEFLEDTYKCRAGLLRVWEAHCKTKKVWNGTTASVLMAKKIGGSRRTHSQIVSQRKAQVEANLIGAIQQVLEDATKKGGVTLSPVAVAGQVMPELVSVCWHYLSAHPSFSVCGENIMGEEFVSLPLNK